MKDPACCDFLAWALPLLGLQPGAFRKVRGQVCKRIARRMHQLGIAGHDEYRRRLEAEAGEWRVLDGLCRITVTRFGRERDAWRHLQEVILPRLAGECRRGGGSELRAWSAGCGGGEEPYTLRLLWDLALAPLYPLVRLDIIATDADAGMLRRAKTATYRHGTLRELPLAWRGRAFEECGDALRLRSEFGHGVRFERQDMREEMPDGPFDLVLCRYLAFTYFDLEGQRAAVLGIAHRLRSGGILMVGAREHPPALSPGIEPEHRELGFWRRGEDA